MGPCRPHGAPWGPWGPGGGGGGGRAGSYNSQRNLTLLFFQPPPRIPRISTLKWGPKGPFLSKKCIWGQKKTPLRGNAAPLATGLGNPSPLGGPRGPRGRQGLAWASFLSHFGTPNPVSEQKSAFLAGKKRPCEAMSHPYQQGLEIPAPWGPQGAQGGPRGLGWAGLGWPGLAKNAAKMTKNIKNCSKQVQVAPFGLILGENVATGSGKPLGCLLGPKTLQGA